MMVSPETGSWWASKKKETGNDIWRLYAMEGEQEVKHS